MAGLSVTLRRWLFPLVALVYLIGFPYHPRLRSPNELCRLWQTRALVEYGQLEINQALRDYGYVGDLSVYQGHYYPSKAPLLSFAAVPIYRGLKAIGGGGPNAVPEVALVFFSRLFLTVLPTLLLLVFIRRFLRTYASAETADAVTATYALGSLALSYSWLFMSHQTTAVLLFGAFYALWRSLRGDFGDEERWGLVLCGALGGAAVAAEYTGGLGLLGLVVFAAVRCLADVDVPMRARVLRLSRSAAWAILGALPFVVGLAAYHQHCFGGPFETGYRHLNDPGYQGWHLGGFLGIRTPDPRAFVLSFFSPLRGLFTLSPFLLLGLYGVFVLGRRAPKARTEAPSTSAELRGLFWTFVALLVAYAYFTSSFSYESWGWTTGPRHLTPLVVFLLLPVALAIDALVALGRGRALGLGVAAGLSAGSMVATGLASFVNYIPDSTSNPVFALALPLIGEGLLPPNALNVLGLRNPAAGWVLIVLFAAAIAVTVAILVASLATLRERAIGAVFSVAVLGVFLGVLAGSTRHDDADQGSLNHLRSVWMVRPGEALELWPNRSGP